MPSAINLAGRFKGYDKIWTVNMQKLFLVSVNLFLISVRQYCHNFISLD